MNDDDEREFPNWKSSPECSQEQKEDRSQGNEDDRPLRLENITWLYILSGRRSPNPVPELQLTS